MQEIKDIKQQVVTSADPKKRKHPSKEEEEEEDILSSSSGSSSGSLSGRGDDDDTEFDGDYVPSDEEENDDEESGSESDSAGDGDEGDEEDEGDLASPLPRQEKESLQEMEDGEIVVGEEEDEYMEEEGDGDHRHVIFQMDCLFAHRGSSTSDLGVIESTLYLYDESDPLAELMQVCADAYRNAFQCDPPAETAIMYCKGWDLQDLNNISPSNLIQTLESDDTQLVVKHRDLVLPPDITFRSAPASSNPTPPLPTTPTTNPTPTLAPLPVVPVVPVVPDPTKEAMKYG